jgi:hypothetical protein
MSERKRLTDILSGTDREKLGRIWETTQAADGLKPLPSGEYCCRVINGELFNSKSGTPGYKLTLEVLDSDYAGRFLWWDCWLSEAALPLAKRDLGKLGITNPEQLEQPLPVGIIVAAKVALRCNDYDKRGYNQVSRFDVIAIEPPEPEPFAPTSDCKAGNGVIDHCDEDDFDWGTGEQTQKDPPALHRGRGAGAYSQP